MDIMFPIGSLAGSMTHTIQVEPSSTTAVKDLMRAYRESLEALKARGVIRSTKVVADYAEWLAAKGLRLELVEGGARSKWALHRAIDLPSPRMYLSCSRCRWLHRRKYGGQHG